MLKATSPTGTTFGVGDQVKVETRDITGAKVHATPYVGTVIAIRGEGFGRTFMIRRLASHKIAVERIFPLKSPYIQKITVLKPQKVRRAKLYYLRNNKN